jgi:hypothetical protein
MQRFNLAGVLIAAGGFCLAATALGDPARADQSAPMSRHVIQMADWPAALCNDGTRPIFYFQPGSGADRNKWVFWFEGGGGCASDVACEARARDTHDLTSSTDRADPTMIPDGILSTLKSVNPDFATYAHVYVHYCSSDMYAGDTLRFIDGQHWQFRGAEIVQALLEQLMTQPIDGAPTLAAASEVLITGSSAGAQGVHNNLDRIAERLAPVQVKGIADAGWTPLATLPYAPPGQTASKRDPALTLAYLNAQPDASCLAANPAHAGDCLNEQFVFPYINTPMLVYADQRDPAILEGQGIRGGPQDQHQLDYVSSFAQSVRATLAAEVPAYFAADRNFHTDLPIPEYASVAIDGVSFGTILHDWYFGTPGPLKAISPPRPEEGLGAGEP